MAKDNIKPKVIEGHGGTDDILYSHFLHPMYASNNNMTTQQKQRKEKKKTVFKRLKALFSKNSTPKKENTVITRPLKNYNDEFIMPHLKNTNITQNFKVSFVASNPNIKNEIGNDIILEPIEKLDINKSKKSISNIQETQKNDTGCNYGIKQIRTTSEIGIQTIWVNNDNGEIKSFQNQSGLNKQKSSKSLSDKNVLELGKKQNESKINNKRKSIKISKEDEEMQLIFDKSQSSENAFIGEGSGILSNESIYTVPLTDQKLSTFEKNLAQNSNHYANDQLNTVSTSGRFTQLQSIKQVNCYINNEDAWPPVYEEITNSTYAGNRTPNKQSYDESELSKSVNSSNSSVNYSKQNNSHLDRNSSSSKEKAYSINSIPNQTILNCEGKLNVNSNENILQGHFGIGSEGVKYLKYKYTEMLSKYSENNIKEKEYEIIRRQPILTQPSTIPTKQIYAAPRIVWSRVASKYGSDVNNNNTAEYLKQIIQNDNMLEDYNNNIETYQWREEGKEMPHTFKNIKQLENNFKIIDTEDEVITGLYKNSNEIINKPFPYSNNGLNVFDLYKASDTEHSSLNISLQQFKDLKNNLCITLCSSTLFDAICQNPDNPPTLNSNNFKYDVFSESDINTPANNTIYSQKSIINTSNSNVTVNSLKKLPITNIPKQRLRQGSPKRIQTPKNVVNTVTNKKYTQVNKLNNTNVKKITPLNGCIRINKQNEIKKKKSVPNNLNNVTKKNQQDMREKTLHSLPHGTFSGNISGPSNRRSTKRIDK